MKLLYCHSCGDMFNLQRELKQCSCGTTKGRYVDNTYAEVNGKGSSLAIGNGSLQDALAQSNVVDMKDWRSVMTDPYARHNTSIICWARPHEGPANSHTKINPNL